MEQLQAKGVESWEVEGVDGMGVEVCDEDDDKGTKGGSGDGVYKGAMRRRRRTRRQWQFASYQIFSGWFEGGGDIFCMINFGFL